MARCLVSTIERERACKNYWQFKYYLVRTVGGSKFEPPNHYHTGITIDAPITFYCVSYLVLAG